MSSKILLLFLATFLCKSILGFEIIKVFHFDPIYGSLDADANVVRFVIDPTLDLSLGFSFCLRANFAILNKKCLFKVADNLHLILQDFENGNGELFFNKIYADFEKDSDELVLTINIFSRSITKIKQLLGGIQILRDTFYGLFRPTPSHYVTFGLSSPLLCDVTEAFINLY